MLVQRNVARTTQPARPVLQTEITSVCVFPDLLAMTVNTVLIHFFVIGGLTQLSNRILRSLNIKNEKLLEGSCDYKSWLSVAAIIIVVDVAVVAAITTAVVGSCLDV